jgi:hypothetical protein
MIYSSFNSCVTNADGQAGSTAYGRQDEDEQETAKRTPHTSKALIFIYFSLKAGNNLIIAAFLFE